MLKKRTAEALTLLIRISAIVAILILCSGVVPAQTQEKVLWSFGGNSSDGIYPVAPLIADAVGNLYGTTPFGGNPSPALAGGTVFELSPQSDGTWAETVLYRFCSQGNCTDGYKPQAGLVMDSLGNLYGTASSGGIVNCPHGTDCGGVVFELSPSRVPAVWTYAVIYTFCSVINGVVCEDGSKPVSQLILDQSGNLYGTTSKGGNGHDVDSYGGGIVFKLSAGLSGWNETVLYSFCQLGEGSLCKDGANPQAGVTFDESGNLFGTTEAGGIFKHGTVYELSPGGAGWAETVLEAFPQVNSYSPVGFDAVGNLYSTTLGYAFQLNAKHHDVRSIVFGDTIGNQSFSGVYLDTRRNALFGTSSNQGANGFGSVWEVVPPGNLSAVYYFCAESNCADGGEPVAGVIEDQLGNIYGTTTQGGVYGQGTVYEIITQ